MIPAYRPNELLSQTLASVLVARDRSRFPSMQIEVVDDASPGVDVGALMQSWGLHGVGVFRRASNGGLGRCWNTCIDRARGTLVHILHQDDLIAPDFYRRMESVAETFSDAGMLFCRTEVLQGEQKSPEALEQATEGPIPQWLEKITLGQRLQCPSVVVRKEMYDRVGGFDESLGFIIDWEMWIRLASVTQVAYVPEPLATYRVHAGSETYRLRAAGAITNDWAKGFQRIKQTLMRAGRLDCLPAVRMCAWYSSAAVAREAEAANRPDLAGQEIIASLKAFGLQTHPRLLLERLRWYLGLRLRMLRRM
jgi:hypothetical protein